MSHLGQSIQDWTEWNLCKTVFKKFEVMVFHDGGCYHIETSPLICCSANQWTGFYMIPVSIMKELSAFFKIGLLIFLIFTWSYETIDAKQWQLDFCGKFIFVHVHKYHLFLRIFASWTLLSNILVLWNRSFINPGSSLAQYL